MATSFTRNLRLKIDSNLTANAKYNLERIDSLGSTFIVDTTDTLKIRSKTNILIEPQSADLGSSLASGGTVSIGTDGNTQIDALNVFSELITMSSPVGIKDQATAGTKNLFLSYKSDLGGAVDTAADRTLSFDLQEANRSLILGGNLELTGGNLVLTLTGNTNVTLPLTGTLATLSNVETLTNKTIDDDNNVIQNLVLTAFKTVFADADKALVRDGWGNVVSSKISNIHIDAGAGIVDSKLATIASAGKVLNSATTATRNNTADTIVLRDSSGNFSAGTISAALNGNASTASFANVAASFTGPLSGDVTGVQSGTVVSFVNGISAGLIAAGATLANSATALNTPNTLVKRDASGNFAVGTITGNLVGVATNVSGIVGIANGGTGATDKESALNNLLPDQAGNAGKVLSTDGSTSSWGNVSPVAIADGSLPRTKLTSGSANHVLINDGSGLVSSEATLSLTRGGTGSSTAVNARTNLLPSQSGQVDKFLRTDGTDVYWSAAAGGGGANFTDLWITADGLTKTVNHNLGTENLSVSIIDLDDDTIIGVDSITVSDANTISLSASETPASSWRIVIQGF